MNPGLAWNETVFASPKSSLETKIGFCSNGFAWIVSSLIAAERATTMLGCSTNNLIRTGENSRQENLIRKEASVVIVNEM